MYIQRVKYKDIEKIPKLQINKSFKQEFQGSIPAPFIGRFGYPKVNIGILSPQINDNDTNYDSPKGWSRSNADIGEIATLRYGLVNSRLKWNIKDANSPQRFLSICKEAGMASKPIEAEVALKKIPTLNFKQEKEIIPWGPASEIKTASITSNVKVDSRIERVVSDTDLKAAPAIASLYQKGFEEQALTKLISVGNVGLGRNRRLVPTRWSITAVDDTIGKNLIAEIKTFQQGDYKAYFGGGWGNYYLLLFFPEIWSYELFETYLDRQVNPWSQKGYMYSTDYESFEGRKNYAEETAGGYYACRIAVLGKMKENKRQNSCLALRFITPEYNIPLGVWVCREAARKSLQARPTSFSSEESMINYAKQFIQLKFGFDINKLIKNSKLLKQKKEQKNLKQYF